MDDERAWHYVRANETTRLPRRHVVIDTEARRERYANGELQRWRCGVAHFIKADKGRRRDERRAEYLAPDQLWRDVDAFCGKRNRTIVWAHNLGYDARIADAFRILPQLGWRVVAYNLAPRGTWLVWRRDDANLTMTDTGSIWPTTLDEIGKMFGLGKTRLPDDQDDDAAWLARCHSDVDITVKAVTTYLDWLETADLGNWQLTGAGQSYAAFRHKHLTHNMLVHADADALAAERVAMWTGRCEAYWHGTILRQVVHEWDLASAYAAVARDYCVPVRLIGPASGREAEKYLKPGCGYNVLAECTVDTGVPVVPTRLDGRIVWPTGHFDTTLWDCEIGAARQAGATVIVHKGWIYRSEPALRQWAQWVLDALAADDATVPAWQKAIFKHWGRALIGRLAMRYSTWSEWATSPHLATERRTMIDLIEDTTYDVTHIGNQMFREEDEQEWSQSMPAVTGYVMAACRVRLWDIVRALPREAVLYVDTDSLLVTDRWYRQVSALAGTGVGRGLRLKRSWDGIAIYGPRQVVTGERVRISGVPVRAVRTGRHTFAGQVWQSVDVALRNGDPDAVRVVDRVWHAAGVDRRRVGRGVGWTEPIHIGVSTK